MLRLRRLEIEGFGPFADLQVIEFPKKPGVVVVYGENMRGKTLLLNAIRFAFFGRAIGRGSRPRKLHSLTNRERAASGKFGFSVGLGFEFDNQQFDLVRDIEPIVHPPSQDGDYRQNVQLRKGQGVLGPQERDRLLAQVFPDEISRFFLFDGELLQEYEELVLGESEAGQKISSAIERILGVPLLKAGRRHLNELADDADKAAAREATKNHETESLGSALNTAIEQKVAHQAELKRKQEEMESLVSQKAEIEAKLSADRKIAQLIDRREAAIKQADLSAERSQQVLLELKGALHEGWRSLLHEPIRRARIAAQAVAEAHVQALEHRLREVAVRSKHCPICEQELDDRACDHIRAKVDSADVGASSAAAGHRLAGLVSFNDRDNRGEISQLVQQLQTLRVEEKTARDEADDLEVALQGADLASARSTQAGYAETSERIAIVRLAIDGEVRRIAELDQNVDRLRQRIRAVHQGDLSSIEVTAKLLRDAASAFEQAVGIYRDVLRGKVEKSATDLFLAMTTEKTDYAKLAINSDYGLAIVHRDGRIEEARSAGAEHVVALALMGALQNNAPLTGPIVMDSPFGRLDERHTSNVVSALHRMAQQVILLVYESEVGRDRVRTLLGPTLLAEYELQRVNSRHTNIRKVQ